MPGARYGRNETYLADVDMTQHRAVVQGSDDQHCKLPTTDDPTDGTLGIVIDALEADRQVEIVVRGEQWVEAGGTCTAGKLAHILEDGKVEDVQTNATPAQQTVLGQFRTSGVDGDLVIVDVQPDFITQ